MYVITPTNLCIYYKFIVPIDIAHFPNLQMMCYQCLNHYAPLYTFLGY